VGVWHKFPILFPGQALLIIAWQPPSLPPWDTMGSSMGCAQKTVPTTQVSFHLRIKNRKFPTIISGRNLWLQILLGEKKNFFGGNCVFFNLLVAYFNVLWYFIGQISLSKQLHVTVCVLPWLSDTGNLTFKGKNIYPQNEVFNIVQNSHEINFIHLQMSLILCIFFLIGEGKGRFLAHNLGIIWKHQINEQFEVQNKNVTVLTFLSKPRMVHQ
jgi:hypothetical protein